MGSFSSAPRRRSHHLYANKKALEGYRTGKFPDGSVIVLDPLEAPAADNAINKGMRMADAQ